MTIIKLLVNNDNFARNKTTKGRDVPKEGVEPEYVNQPKILTIRWTIEWLQSGRTKGVGNSALMRGCLTSNFTWFSSLLTLVNAFTRLKRLSETITNVDILLSYRRLILKLLLRDRKVIATLGQHQTPTISNHEENGLSMKFQSRTTVFTRLNWTWIFFLEKKSFPSWNLLRLFKNYAFYRRILKKNCLSLGNCLSLK